MNVVERLQKMLCECLGICVPQEEIAVESVQLYADEMDEKLVPVDVLKNVTAPINAEIVSYRNEIGVEYLLIQLEIGKGKIHEVWLVDDEVVDVNSLQK
ncbi:hypothetical protein [Kurthia huakuii]|uniref:hypothetical protein n=1 Tax=Kurthia huakuii TaxID=1421019 RepID=UPI000495819E|nr:hypothetical protein [Kurthia huakuii]MBM7701142.1 hypothetical protein [Kurthia huakuii]